MKLVAVERSEMTLPELVKLAQTDTVVLTRNGKPLVSVKDLVGSDWESISLANNAKFQAIIETSRRAYRAEGGIELDELRRELSLEPSPKRKRSPRKRD